MPCSFTTGSRFRDCFAEDRLGQFATEGDWIRHTRNAALNLAAVPLSVRKGSAFPATQKLSRLRLRLESEA